MDSTVVVARRTAPSIVFLRSEIPAQHPSAAVLGEERMGTGVAVGPHHVLTAHYLVLGARKLEVAGPEGRGRAVRATALDHESGLALLALDGPPLPPAEIAPQPVAPGLPVFLLTCTSERERKGASGHVSMVGPFEAFWEYMLDRAIMTTVINPGLAGAPLFDPDGRLLGIVSLGLAAVARDRLAIPVGLLVARRDALERGQGRAEGGRGWLGFYPPGYDGGVAPTGVVPRCPADEAGPARGDRML